jgi:glycosyltransferase involved in cell wall biosynthesis
MAKILCFSYERLFCPNNIISGPGFRLWEIAQILLKKGHKVTIAQLNHDKNYSKQGIKFISWDTETLKNIQKEYDVAYLPLTSFVDQYFDKINKIPTIIDLSTPLIIESMAHHLGEKNNFYLNQGILPTYLALTNADYFVCSNNAQKVFYLGMLSILGIKNFNKNLIKIVPFAPRLIYANKKIKSKNILQKVVGKNKKIILNMGGLYSWYDYKTPILSLKKIVNIHPDVALVFVGALNPNVADLTKQNYNDAKKLAKSIGLLNKNIYFSDWVSSVDRLSLYKESTVAIVTSIDKDESALTHRIRIVDYWNGNLPVICSDSEGLANNIKNNNLGLTYKTQNKQDLSLKIIQMFNNPKTIDKFKRNISKFIKTNFNLENTIEPIHKFCLNPKTIDIKAKLDFYQIINQQKNRIKNLEYIKDDKEGVNKSLVDEIKRLQVEMINYRTQLSVFENNHKINLNEIIKFKEKIEFLTNELNEKNIQLSELHDIISKQDHSISKLKKIVGEFRSSVIYPFYKLTHKIGQSKIGKLIQKFVK